MREADNTVCKCVKSAGKKKIEKRNPHVIASMSRLAWTLFTWNCTPAPISQKDRQAPVQSSLTRSWRAPFLQILLGCTPLLVWIWIRPVFIPTFCLWKTVWVPVPCTHRTIPLFVVTTPSKCSNTGSYKIIPLFSECDRWAVCYSTNSTFYVLDLACV